MLHVRLGCLLVSGLLLAGCGGGGGGGGDPGEPITVTLRNDTYETGDPQAFVTTFLSGDACGATLGPAPVVMTLDRIDFRWGPVGAAGNFNLRVHRDTGANDPGPVLVTIGRQLTPTADGWQTFDVSSASILLGVGQSVRFVVEYLGSVAAGPARDGDGTNTAGQNWIYSAGTWSPSSASAIPGDWIVRGIGTFNP
jgi:hypothetical protein